MRKLECDYILKQIIDYSKDISDINITAGKPFQVEIAGVLTEVKVDSHSYELTAFQTEIFALNLLNKDRRLTEILLKEGSCDLSYELGDEARFRVNIFSQQGKYSIVLRKLTSRIPSCDDLNLPSAFIKMAEEKNGIIFVTGSTGSGKTTSLTAILNEINKTQSVHVVTLEDPLEFIHKHKKSTFNQRELGKDFDSFASGLRAALRQAPKVILVGEMRDRETVEIGLTAAETGHLVLSTLHTVDAGQTINRILGMFKTFEENHVRTRLADSIRWIVCQRLLPKLGGGMTAAFEIMGNNLRIKEVISNGESEGKTFYEIIHAGKAFGMITFDESIINLYEKGHISEETAKAYASRKGIVGRAVDSLKKRRGEYTGDIDNLEIDRRYGKDKKRSI